MNKIIDFVKKSGLLFYLLFVFVNYLILNVLAEYFTISLLVLIVVVFIAPLVVHFEIIIKNINSKKNADIDSNAHFKALYPSVPTKYLSKKPRDMLLGIYQNKYVCLPVQKDGINGIITGTPGAGKSLILKAQILANEYKLQINPKDASKINSWNYFLIDVDGLIYKDINKIQGKYKADYNSKLHVVELSNRDSFGFDVFYKLRKENVSETEKLKTVTDIADALIQQSGDNPYFSVNAKKILTGILLYGIGEKMDFISIIQLICRSNLYELLSEIIESAKDFENSIVIDKLKSFVGKDDNESLQDVEATMKQCLDIFSYPDIIYCFQTNPKKTSPQILNDGQTNLVFAVETSMLTVYQPIFRLVTMMVLRHCESDFTESDNRYTSILVDEAARIGRVEDLSNLMATGRKYHINILMFFQDLSQFKMIYSKRGEFETIINLCELKAFLSGSDADTIDYLSKIVGKYDEIRQSYKKDKLLHLQADTNYQEEKKDIIDGKSLMMLREKDELIVIAYGHYMRIKKIRYYSDRILAPIYKKIQQYNTAEKEEKNNGK